MFQKKRPKTGASATTEGMEDKEALEATTVVSETADSVKDDIDLLFPDRIVTTCVCESGKGQVTPDKEIACTNSYSRRPPSL